jgi:hypothetical protein
MGGLFMTVIRIYITLLRGKKEEGYFRKWSKLEKQKRKWSIAVGPSLTGCIAVVQ